MIPHFTLRQNKGEYLIIRMGDEFHIIDCNEALTKEKRRAVLESGCTPAQMQEMGLSGMTVPKSDIRALTVTGYGFQDGVIFYLKNKKKLCYWLPRAYEQKKVDDFFRGIPRKMVKTRRRLRGGKNLGWREREGDPEMSRRLRPVGWAMNALGIGLAVLPLVVRIPLGLHGGLVLLFGAAAVCLDIFFPEYFSLLMEGKKERREKEGLWVNICFGLFVAMMPLALRISLTIHLFDGFRFLPVAMAMTLAVGAVLFLFCREFREEWAVGLCALFLVFIVSWLGYAPLAESYSRAGADTGDGYHRRTAQKRRQESQLLLRCPAPRRTGAGCGGIPVRVQCLSGRRYHGPAARHRLLRHRVRH